VKYNGIGIVTLAYSMGWVEAESTILPLILPGWLFGGPAAPRRLSSIHGVAG